MSAGASALRRTLIRAVKGSTVLRRAARLFVNTACRVRYFLRGLHVKTDGKTVVFEAYGGKSYACSPRAIYEYMLSAPQYAAYKFIWIFRDPEPYRFLEQNGRTTLVRYKSAAADRAMRGAKYWIYNFRALDEYVPRRGQVYVQCWHGTPLKKLGYDLERSENPMNSIAEIRARYRTDAKRFRFLLSPSPFATEKFSTAWNLRETGRADRILECGYPRNDFLHTYTAADAERIKAALGLSGETRKILLYAPTWRDNQHTSGVGYTYECPVDFAALRRALGDEYVLLFRAHYLVANAFDFEAHAGFVYDVSAVDDINELYVISDMLITDYSSVFFDYANLERPMIFYMYDLDFYRTALHDFYLDLAALPGEIVQTEDALIEAVRKAEAQPDLERVRAFRAEFCPKDDGEAARRATEVILNA